MGRWMSELSRCVCSERALQVAGGDDGSWKAGGGSRWFEIVVQSKSVLKNLGWVQLNINTHQRGQS